MFDFETYEMWKIIEELARKTGDSNLMLRCARANGMRRVNSTNNYKKLVDDVANEVLSRLSISTDVENAIKQIDSLNTAINALANK